MELVWPKIDLSQFGIGDFDAGRVTAFVQFGMNPQSCSGSRGGDQVDDDLQTDQRFAAPVLSDEGEQSVLDLVPLAGAWWKSMGRETYPRAGRLLITADSGGSNGARLRLWKVELQKLADETGLRIAVCHFPPGTSKWNKIEHRLFSFITQNWRGKPLIS